MIRSRISLKSRKGNDSLIMEKKDESRVGGEETVPM